MPLSDVTIVVVTDRQDAHWCESAREIHVTLEAAAMSMPTPPTLKILEAGELRDLSCRTKGECLSIICHPTDRVLTLITAGA